MLAKIDWLVVLHPALVKLDTCDQITLMRWDNKLPQLGEVTHKTISVMNCYGFVKRNPLQIAQPPLFNYRKQSVLPLENKRAFII